MPATTFAPYIFSRIFNEGIFGTARRRAAPLAIALGLALALGVAGCSKKEKVAPVPAANISEIGVNSYLWRAALDTLKFMPLAQVDSKGGVIIGDWYQNPAQPAERMKVRVVILDTTLRADALQVTATREVLSGGSWVPATVQAGTVQRLEDVILERARQLRQATVTQ